MFGFLHPGVSVVWIVFCCRLGWNCVQGDVGRNAVCSVMISLGVVSVSGLIVVGTWFCRVGWFGVLVFFWGASQLKAYFFAAAPAVEAPESLLVGVWWIGF